MRTRNRPFNGFTLIELLVVIAIIAILAAILFPVFSIVKENVRKTTCMTQMQRIGQAVAQYKLDNNKYPATLYGVAELANGNPYIGSGVPVPMTKIANKPLFGGQKLVNDNSLYFCPDNVPQDLNAVVNPVYPVTPGVTLVGPVMSGGNPVYFYTGDSYDVGPQVDKNGAPVKVGGNIVMQLHYSLGWTAVTGPGDNGNQLKYSSPLANSTVITWCTYHSAIANNPIINVLMLSGRVKSVPVSIFASKGPLAYSE